MFHKYDYGTCDYRMARQLESQYIENDSEPFNQSMALGIILLEISVVLIICLLPKSELGSKATLHIHKASGLHHSSRHTA